MIVVDIWLGVLTLLVVWLAFLNRRKDVRQLREWIAGDAYGSVPLQPRALLNWHDDVNSFRDHVDKWHKAAEPKQLGTRQSHLATAE